VSCWTRYVTQHYVNVNSSRYLLLASLLLVVVVSAARQAAVVVVAEVVLDRLCGTAFCCTHAAAFRRRCLTNTVATERLIVVVGVVVTLANPAVTNSLICRLLLNTKCWCVNAEEARCDVSLCCTSLFDAQRVALEAHTAYENAVNKLIDEAAQQLLHFAKACTERLCSVLHTARHLQL
jgi:hypothetical protein